jgi:DNA-directed RNA polymerase sigma subunit (sigma70/sigma32)|tara:strand:+ start:1487 stop:1729 length:243 start_codon:yes stop_codon:yes gene_type:complete
MRDCAKECYLAKTSCKNRECRLFIEYEEDLNCTILAVKKHGPMTLEEIGKRHGVSTVRIKQIVDATLLKLKKTLLRENTI